MANLLVRTLIYLYRISIVPFLQPCCRFYPSCSSYALTCFERFGFFKALGKTIIRLMKCHPFHPGGHDPVGERGAD